MTSHLVSKSTFQARFSTRLPDHLLHSSEFYATEEGYDILLNFSDDDEIIEAQQEGQYSYGLDEWLDIEIDRLFKKYNCPDKFSDEALEELKAAIDEKLASLNLEEAVIL